VERTRVEKIKLATTPGLVNGGVMCKHKVLSSLQRLPTVDSDDLVGLSIPRCSIAKAS